MKDDSLLMLEQEEDTQKDKFLTFSLGKEYYGLEIRHVTEIIGIQPITEVPELPEYVRGIINLRGKIIPIIDLRLRFGMPTIEQTDETCIVVVRAAGLEMGIVVDRVSDVLNISSADIEDVPEFGVDIDTDFLIGVGKVDGRVKLLLDIDRVLSATHMQNLARVTSE